MLTEFEVRCQMDAIQTSKMSPHVKARKLLRLSRSLERQSRVLNSAKHQIAKTPDRNSASGLTRMIMRTQQLLYEVRDAAYEALQSGFRSPSLSV